jgi:hypothetical protein
LNPKTPEGVVTINAFPKVPTPSMVMPACPGLESGMPVRKRAPFLKTASVVEVFGFVEKTVPAVKPAKPLAMMK